MFLNKCRYLIERTSYSSCVIFFACFSFMKEIISEHDLERLVILPFPSMGCISDSSVAVVTNQTKKHKSNSETIEDETRRQGKEKPNGVKMRRNSWGFLSFPKFGISRGVQRLMKRVKSLSQLFVYKEEVEEIEKELEIGYPTDVKHVTHIGWDGSTTINPVKGWENLKPPELLTSPSISLKQFELAMAAQAGAPLGVNCSKLTNS